MRARQLTVSLVAAAVLGGTLIAAAPPSGRPPINALRRYDPEKYELKFEVLLQTLIPGGRADERRNFDLSDVPIVMPVIYQGAYSKVFPGTEDKRVILDFNIAADIPAFTDENKPFHTHHLRMVIPKFQGQAVRWTVVYTGQSWSADIDDRIAQQSRWPRDMKWPDEVADALKPQMFIESDNEFFHNLIAAQGGETLRSMSPYLAAKKIIAFTLNAFQLNGTATRRGTNKVILGMNVNGALAAATTNSIGDRAMGTDHDLVCLCVAMLRAANIPARPVIGILEDNRGAADFVSWAELYIPDSGWMSFDPVAMKRSGPGRYRDETARWEHFGVMEELNERFPLSYHFHAPGGGLVVPGHPAVWAWDTRTAQPGYEQTITIDLTSRGRGEEDPG